LQLVQFTGQLGQYLEEIADDPLIGDLEDRRFLVLVDPELVHCNAICCGRPVPSFQVVGRIIS
jgi:hypothetical protein